MDMARQGSFVSDSQFYNVLRVMGAERNGQGQFLVRGGIASFMGLGRETVVDETAQARVNGVWTGILPMIKATSYHQPISVI